MAKLLVGLGNPGSRYDNTRHNLGWDALERISRKWGISSGGVRFQGRFGSGTIQNHKAYTLQPTTYMNLSGRAVGEAMRFFKILPEEVVVFHDDLDLPLGKVKMKLGGGNAGHNGLKSIQECLGTADFVRVRLGIGRPDRPEAAAGFVLAPFTASEREILEPCLSLLPEVIPLILDGELAGAMNRLALTGKEKPSQNNGKLKERATTGDSSPPSSRD